MAIYKEFEASSVDILREAHARHGEGLRILSSFGVDSALTIRLARIARIPLRVVGIHTGFWFPETHVHQRQLEQSEGFFTTKYGLSDIAVADITDKRLWETDLSEYNRRTKAEPLTQAIGELGITALVSGVRREQTPNRASLETYGIGNDGEVRVNAVLGWTDAAVEDYFMDKVLLRHPLYYKGYGSVGDWTLTTPGAGRSGRNLGEHSECGINLEPALVSA